MMLFFLLGYSFCKYQSRVIKEVKHWLWLWRTRHDLVCRMIDTAHKMSPRQLKKSIEYLQATLDVEMNKGDK
jgi:hypothetical protein